MTINVLIVGDTDINDYDKVEQLLEQELEIIDNLAYNGLQEEEEVVIYHEGKNGLSACVPKYCLDRQYHFTNFLIDPEGFEEDAVLKFSSELDYVIAITKGGNEDVEKTIRICLQARVPFHYRVYSTHNSPHKEQ